jgi:EpsI family protein
MGNQFVVRALLVSACLFGAAGMIARSSKSEVVPIRTSLAQFPSAVGVWRGQNAGEFTSDILAVLGVDEYLNRMYYARTAMPVSLYIGYYQSQRQGDTIHSPLNCLPGAGWIPVQRRRIQVPVVENGTPKEIEINSIEIEKGLDRQAVLYWYQGHGRVVASEYWGKAYGIWDALRLNRTDGALVRVIVPFGRGTGEDAGDAESLAAEKTAVTFVKEMFPRLSDYLPS